MILIGFLINDLTFLSYVTCWDETTIVMSLGTLLCVIFWSNRPCEMPIGTLPFK